MEQWKSKLITWKKGGFVRTRTNPPVSATATNVTVQQTGLSTVLVMWTAPSPPPTDGYQVQTTRGSTTTTVIVVGTSHTISTNNQYGVYSIQVIALSRPVPSDATDPVEVTVRGNSIDSYVRFIVVY